ncbi:MAG TPA: hypothetical protein PLR26_00365 [Bacilli bacterium]|nr:hypothetical protein [Bacilli bacterium]
MNNKVDLKFNDKYVDVRQWMMFDVNGDFDVTTDLKLGSKSITLKFYETILKNIEFDENLVTINGMLNVLNSEINNMEKIELDGIEVVSRNLELNSKNIIKLLNSGLLKEGLESNQYDLSFQEIICLQLSIIHKIAQGNSDKITLILLEAPYLDTVMIRHIKQINCKNLYILINTNYFHTPIEISDYLLITKDIIVDFANEDDIYNKIIMEMNSHYEVNEINDKLVEIITGSHSKFTDQLKTLR